MCSFLFKTRIGCGNYDKNIQSLMSNKSTGDNCSQHNHIVNRHRQTFSNSTSPCTGQNTIECLHDFHLKPNIFDAPVSNAAVWALSKSVSSNTKAMSKIEAGQILLEQSHWTTCSAELLNIDKCPLCFDPPFNDNRCSRTSWDSSRNAWKFVTSTKDVKFNETTLPNLVCHNNNNNI